MENESGAVPPPVERGLDRLVTAASWIWLLLVAVIVAAVLLRALFGIGRIELEELQWHLYAVGFLVGIIGCVLHDRHVRVDVFREGMRQRHRDWIDLYGLLLLQLPFLFLILVSSLPLAAESFAFAERSSSPGGLPARWILKGVLPLASILLLAASASRLVTVARRLMGPSDSPEESGGTTGAIESDGPSSARSPR